MTTLDPQDPAATGKQHADIVGMGVGDGPGPEVMAASTLDGNKVMSSDGEHLGKISDIMLDVRSGRIAYAVLSSGAFLGVMLRTRRIRRADQKRARLRQGQLAIDGGYAMGYVRA
jgi:uncharacterized protein YrrD